MRSLGLALLLGLAALPASLGCGYGYYGSLGTNRKTTSSSASAWVAGGGTISSTRTVVGPYGSYPVSGVYVGPGGSGSYDYGTYGPYGVSPYGAPAAPGAYYGPAYGGPAYGSPAYGTYTTCSGAVACGASTTVTTGRSYP